MWNCVFWCILQRVFSHISTHYFCVLLSIGYLLSYCKKKKKILLETSGIPKSGNVASLYLYINFENVNIFPKLVRVWPSILELTLFCIYSEKNYGKSNILIAEFFFLFLCTKWMENCDHQLTHLHIYIYSYWLVKKCFLKICKTSKCQNFLIFQLIFIKFSLCCLKIVILSSEIKLKLFRISPLKLPGRGGSWMGDYATIGEYPVRTTCTLVLLVYYIQARRSLSSRRTNFNINGLVC